MILCDKVIIGLPYDIKPWLVEELAISEGTVDWRSESSEAALCTEAYAVFELSSHLRQILPELCVEYATGKDALSADIVIGKEGLPESYRLPQKKEESAESFYLKTVNRNGNEQLIISARSPVGTLYGVYAFLEILGVRWFRPESYGTYIPRMKQTEIPSLDILEQPSYSMFRGFYIYVKGKIRREMFIWMARNKLNLWADQPGYVPLMRKLGIKFLDGGHIIESFIHPDLKMETGHTQFEEHPEWFAEVNGRRSPDVAKSNQFCTSNEKAVQYLIERLVEAIPIEYPNANFLDLWGYDTWAGTCQCAECRKLGNDTDKYIHLIAEVRQGLDEAFKKKKIQKNPHLVLAAYEGTSSLESPSRDLPEGFDSQRDSVTFFPINRCYHHRIDDPVCSEINKNYNDTFTAWKKSPFRGDWIIGEYYNVSKFEDIPLVFYDTIPADVAYYYDLGARGIHHMHVSLSNWGVRALTNYLFAKCTWNVNCDAKAIIADYFEKSYGSVSDTMREFYDCLKEAYANVAVWRNWAKWSVTSILRAHGKTFDGPLFPTAHLKLNRKDMPGPALGPSGEESLEYLVKARKLINQVLKGDNLPLSVKKRIKEDEALFTYGENSMFFYFWCSCYYLKKQSGDHHGAKEALKCAMAYADNLAKIDVPWPGLWPEEEGTNYNGLDKTQIQDIYKRWIKDEAKIGYQ